MPARRGDGAGGGWRGAALALLPRRFWTALVWFLSDRIQVLMGKRESHKFCVVRVIAALRAEALYVGETWVRRGLLRAADDVFYLRAAQLDDAQHGMLDAAGIARAVDDARARCAHEARRKRVPETERRGRSAVARKVVVVSAPPPPQQRFAAAGGSWRNDII